MNRAAGNWTRNLHLQEESFLSGYLLCALVRIYDLLFQRGESLPEGMKLVVFNEDRFNCLVNLSSTLTSTPIFMLEVV